MDDMTQETWKDRLNFDGSFSTINSKELGDEALQEPWKEALNSLQYFNTNSEELGDTIFNICIDEFTKLIVSNVKTLIAKQFPDMSVDELNNSTQRLTDSFYRSLSIRIDTLTLKFKQEGIFSIPKNAALKESKLHKMCVDANEKIAEHLGIEAGADLEQTCMTASENILSEIKELKLKQVDYAVRMQEAKKQSEHLLTLSEKMSSLQPLMDESNLQNLFDQVRAHLNTT